MAFDGDAEAWAALPVEIRKLVEGVEGEADDADGPSEPEEA